MFFTLISGTGFSPEWDSALVWIYYLMHCAGPLGILLSISARYRRERRALHARDDVNGEAGTAREVTQLALVVWVAFGMSIFHSLGYLVYGATIADGPKDFTWGDEVWGILGKAACLLLLAYVLRVSGRKFSDLGLKWDSWQCAIALPLIVGCYTLNSVWAAGVYGIVEVAIDWPVPHPDIGAHLFGERIRFVSVIGALVNGFYEELIVRAYLMTQLERLCRSKLLAIFISVVIQVSYHFYQGTPAALSHVAAFLILACYYSRTRQILPVALAHVFYDLLPMISHAASLEPLQ